MRRGDGAVLAMIVVGLVMLALALGGRCARAEFWRPEVERR